MHFDDFKSSLSAAQPPASANAWLRSLWYDAKGDWEQAHNIIQSIEDKTAARIHAYLHRREGDEWNANYWYNKAGRRMPGYSLDKELEEIVKELLEHGES
ncbi:MAG: hypothetical protein JST39_11490 [Bacteroidetes bacterium]|nr:hypothetical protein [Bacteroidota bacterium]